MISLIKPIRSLKLLDFCYLTSLESNRDGHVFLIYILSVSKAILFFWQLVLFEFFKGFTCMGWVPLNTWIGNYILSLFLLFVTHTCIKVPFHWYSYVQEYFCLYAVDNRTRLEQAGLEAVEHPSTFPETVWTMKRWPLSPPYSVAPKKILNFSESSTNFPYIPL